MPQCPVPKPECAKRVKLRFFADKAQLFLAAQTIRPHSRHDFAQTFLRMNEPARFRGMISHMRISAAPAPGAPSASAKRPPASGYLKQLL